MNGSIRKDVATSHQVVGCSGRSHQPTTSPHALCHQYMNICKRIEPTQRPCSHVLGCYGGQVLVGLRGAGSGVPLRRPASPTPTRNRELPTTCIPALAPKYRGYGSPANKPQPWQVVAAVSAVAMLLCNFHRSVFTALLPLVAGGLALQPAEVGLLQSSMLWGYLVGQIPSGKLADEQGGDRVLLAGLALWSLATAATAVSAAATSQTGALVSLLVARVAMGLFSSVIMPAVSALTAQWVPAERKAAVLALIYAFFNVGGVVGLIAAPIMATRNGWPSAFVSAAAGGVMWALLGSAAISRAGSRPPLPKALAADAAAVSTLPKKQEAAHVSAPGSRWNTTETKGSPTGVDQRTSPSSIPMSPSSSSPTAMPSAAAAQDAPSFASASTPAAPPTPSGGAAPRAAAGKLHTLMQLAALCWCHGVIGWGFFVLQSWIPLYLQSLGVADLASAGLLASLPWLAAAFTATIAGGLADRLVRSGRMSRLTVRRVMHSVATLGCAAAVLPLAAAPASAPLSPLVATLCLVASVGCYGFCFGGFHSYVQDVASADAGKVLGFTNTVSTLGGISGNLATGWLLQVTGGYSGVFWVAAALYLSSWLCFFALLRGEPISLAGL